MAIGMKLRWPSRLSLAHRPTVRKERHIIRAVLRNMLFLRFSQLLDYLFEEVKLLPAVLVKEVEGAYGRDNFGETGEEISFVSHLP